MIYLYSHLKVYTAIITVWSQPTGACGVWQTTSSWTWRWQTSSWPHSTAFSPSSTWETGMRSFLIWAIFYIHIPDTIGNVSRDWHLKVHYSKVSTLHTWHISFIHWPQELALWWVLLLHEPVHLPVLSALLGVHHVGHHTGPEASHHVPTSSKVNKKTFIDMMLKLSEFPSHCILFMSTKLSLLLVCFNFVELFAFSPKSVTRILKLCMNFKIKSSIHISEVLVRVQFVL